MFINALNEEGNYEKRNDSYIFINDNGNSHNANKFFFRYCHKQ